MVGCGEDHSLPVLISIFMGMGSLKESAQAERHDE